MSLRQKTISGFIWVGVERFSLQGLQFVLSIILARILLPAEFGLIGMISILFGVSQILIDSGLTTSLIRKSNVEDIEYDTIFYFNLMGSALVYILIFFSAPFIATFYHEPILINLSRVAALSLLINSFSSIQNTRLTKLMQFKTLAKIQIPSLIIGGVIGVVMAYQGYGVWSILATQLGGSVISCIQLWVYSNWRPQIRFSLKVLKDHFSFSMNITLAEISNVLFNDIYNIVIGKFFSATQLGFYTRANSLKQLPVTNLSSIVNKVAFPAFAEMQHDNERLKMAVKRIMQQIIFWVAPLLIGLAVLAEPLFRFLFTEKWLPAVPYFQLLCITGILHPLQSYNLLILQVKGRSDLFLKIEIIKKVMISIGVWLIIPYGIFGLLYFQIAFSITAYFINSYYSGYFIGYSVKEQLKDISGILALAVIMGIICFVINHQVAGWPDLSRLIVVGFIGMFFYLFSGYLIRLDPLVIFVAEVKSKFKRPR
ncbi:MAG TPA: lipopolysaccharide biosynthesis protein [Cyclobacteriaceae bacterium]